MTLLIIYIVFHIVCGVLAYGGTLAYFQREYSLVAQEDFKSNRFIAISMSMFGPFGLAVCWFSSNCFRHGLVFRRDTK